MQYLTAIILAIMEVVVGNYAAPPPKFIMKIISETSRYKQDAVQNLERTRFLHFELLLKIDNDLQRLPTTFDKPFTGINEIDLSATKLLKIAKNVCTVFHIQKQVLKDLIFSDAEVDTELRSHIDKICYMISNCRSN